MSFRHFACVAIVLGISPAVLAQIPTSFTLPVQPVYDFVVFADPDPLDLIPEGGSDIILNFAPLGTMDFEFANNDINDPMSTSATLSNLTGFFTGEALGLPFSLNIFNFVGGELTNITRDGAGNLLSADVTFTGEFEHVVDPAGQNIRLFGDPMTFTATVGEVPFPNGTSFTSPVFRNLYLDLGSGMQPLLVGGVQDRFLNVVPEPSTFALLGLAGVGFVAWRRR